MGPRAPWRLGPRGPRARGPSAKGSVAEDIENGPGREACPSQGRGPERGFIHPGRRGPTLISRRGFISPKFPAAIQPPAGGGVERGRRGKTGDGIGGVRHGRRSHRARSARQERFGRPVLVQRFDGQ